MRLIVYNPAGGAAIRGGRLTSAIRELQALGPSRLVATEARDMIGPIRRALEASPGVTQVVACGGDGTVAACAAAVGNSGIPIAVIPTGTTNVLTFELNLPNSAVRSARALAGPMQRRRFRTWSVNGRPMLLQLGVGFDGQLMWKTSRRTKRIAGFLGVVITALRLGPSFDYPEINVVGEREDGSEFTATATSVMVANAKRWAGPQLAVPNADPADDFVDVLILNYRSFLQLARFWIAILFPGSPHLRLPFVSQVRLKRLTLTAPARPVEAHLDGEPDLTTPITVEPLGSVTLLGL